MAYNKNTPVKNEAMHIQKTVEAVISQSEIPELWVIVDGGSTDGTIDKVREYMANRDWIKVIRQIEAE
jgi:glycosyltransferase involved in cell wall biosynthesis